MKKFNISGILMELQVLESNESRKRRLDNILGDGGEYDYDGEKKLVSKRVIHDLPNCFSKNKSKDLRYKI